MKYFNLHEDIEKTHHKLPHWQQGAVPIFVTFRLADSLPEEVLGPWLAARDAFVAANPEPWDEATEAVYHSRFSDQLDEYLDAGYGCCALRGAQTAQIVEDRLRFFDGQRYLLSSFVVMPNHVHVLFELNEGESLAETVQAWKGVSSRLVHKAALSDLNPLWQPEYYDRLIRSVEHFETVRAYVRENPAKAGLREGFRYWERT